MNDKVLTDDKTIDDYEDVITTRYSRDELRKIFSETNTVKTWRKCWIALAESEYELGLKAITKEMIIEMKKNIDKIDLNAAREKENEIQHDLMSHVYAYGLVCPKAKGIIHLGATSQCIKCNTDLILQYEALKIIRSDIIKILKAFYDTILKTKKIKTLSYTHYQPAQPTTIGRRFCMYAQDILMDLEEIDSILKDYRLRGTKGATGTQASYLKLFENPSKVKRLDELFVKKLGFNKSYPITTQTYTRKFDIRIANLLASICSTCKKFATDIRLLSNLGILEEPFKSGQTGSSAMPYKRNPMISERICSLSRKVINNAADFYEVYSEQWLERTLDDSAVRRIDIPQNFMLTDYILLQASKIVEGMIVFEKQSEKLLKQELAFMATEDILMECVKKGADRQKMHEIIKEHSFEVIKNIKLDGKDNDLLQRLSNDDRIPLKKEDFDKILNNDNIIGLSVEQAEDFCKNYLKPVIRKT
jgi:adenylosuccinate lyase